MKRLTHMHMHTSTLFYGQGRRVGGSRRDLDVVTAWWEEHETPFCLTMNLSFIVDVVCLQLLTQLRML
jgi:hypothetical protein